MKKAKVIFIALLIPTLLINSRCTKKTPTPTPTTPAPTTNSPILSNWTTQTSNVSNFLLKVDFANQNDGLISGIGGIILKTIDGGNSYQQQTSGTTEDLYALDMVTESVAYAGGNNGSLVKTTDGGVTWHSVSVGTTDNLRKLYFLDANIGFAGFGQGGLYKTTDGGQHWTQINLSGSNSGIYGMHFLNDSVGYMSGQHGYLAKTINRGINWTTLTSGVSTANGSILGDIQFVNSTVGYCSGSVNVGNGTVIQDSYILKTIDGGQSWTRQSYSYTNQVISGIQMIDEKTGFVAGGDVTTNTGFVASTTDGQNWSTIKSTSNRLISIKLIGNNLSFAVGNNGTIIKGN